MTSDSLNFLSRLKMIATGDIPKLANTVSDIKGVNQFNTALKNICEIKLGHIRYVVI